MPGPLSFLLGCAGGLLAIQLAVAGRAGANVALALLVALGLAFVAALVFGLSAALLGRFPGYRSAFLLGLACPSLAALAGWALAFDNHPPEHVFGLSLLLCALLPALAPLVAPRQRPPTW